MKKLLSIGEMAKLTDVSIQRLRYYDNIKLFSPASIDETTNYRYYTQEQATQLRIIQQLQYIGFTLNEIKQFLVDHSTNTSIQELLDKKKTLLENKEAEIQRKKDLLNSYLYVANPKDNQIYTTTWNAFPMYPIDTVTRNLMDINDQTRFEKLIVKELKKQSLSKAYIPYFHLPTMDLNNPHVFIKKEDNSKQQVIIPESTYYYCHSTHKDLEENCKRLIHKANDLASDLFLETLPLLNPDEEQTFIIYLRLKNSK